MLFDGRFVVVNPNQPGNVGVISTSGTGRKFVRGHRHAVRGQVEDINLPLVGKRNERVAVIPPNQFGVRQELLGNLAAEQAVEVGLVVNYGGFQVG